MQLWPESAVISQLITPFMVSYNPIYSDLHLLKGFNCGMIELLQGFSMAKGLVFGHSQKKRDKPINPKPVLIDNNADINQNIRSTKYFPLLPELSGLQWLPHWSYNDQLFASSDASKEALRASFSKIINNHRSSFCDYGIREFGRICLR